MELLFQKDLTTKIEIIKYEYLVDFSTCLVTHQARRKQFYSGMANFDANYV